MFKLCIVCRTSHDAQNEKKFELTCPGLQRCNETYDKKTQYRTSRLETRFYGMPHNRERVATIQKSKSEG